MDPIEFKEVNVRIAEKQDEYVTLPANVDAEGAVSFCMKLSKDEVIEILETGHVWLQVLTFNNPLQPMKLSVSKPDGFEEIVQDKKYRQAVAVEIVAAVIDKTCDNDTL